MAIFIYPTFFIKKFNTFPALIITDMFLGLLCDKGVDKTYSLLSCKIIESLSTQSQSQ